MRFILWTLVAGLLLYGLVLAGLYTFQRRLLFIPDTTTPDPYRAGLLDVAVLHIPTDDGLSLTSWYVPPADPTGFTVLLLHGNAGNIGHRANRLRRMRELGWGVLLLEYRGYGGNPGSPSEDGLMRDAQAGLAELRRRGVPSDRTLLWANRSALASRFGWRRTTRSRRSSLTRPIPVSSTRPSASIPTCRSVRC